MNRPIEFDKLPLTRFFSVVSVCDGDTQPVSELLIKTPRKRSITLDLVCRLSFSVYLSAHYLAFVLCNLGRVLRVDSIILVAHPVDKLIHPILKYVFVYKLHSAAIE